MKKTARINFVIFLFYLLFAAGLCAQTPTPDKTPDGKAIASNLIYQPATLDTGKGTLYGTLTLPGPRSKYPVVLIIAGSGPTDRDGNSPLLNGPNNSLQMLADGLAANGIASLRYDKRGIAASAASMGSEADLRFDDYINDAVLWAKQLRADKRFTILTIAGHSEGSLIGMVAARLAGADAYVSIAGLGRPAGQAILDQIRPQLPPELMKAAEDTVATLQAGKTSDSVPKELGVLFRPSVQPYMASWFRYDPALEISKLKVPVLIVQGTTDIQVGVSEARLLAQAQPAARLLIIDQMNHILKRVSADHDEQIKSYGDPTLHIMPQLISEISALAKNDRRQK